jgi:type IV pilus assembly protein PilA
MQKSSLGFSLIELLIVVTIILILAAISLPNWLKARMAANQASAVQSLRTISSAEITYSATYSQGFASSLAQLGPPTSGPPTSAAAGMIDNVLASGIKSGYSFNYTPGATVNGVTPTYSITASPMTPGTSGQNFYYSDSTNVIRQNLIQTASSTDSPIGG